MSTLGTEVTPEELVELRLISEPHRSSSPKELRRLLPYRLAGTTPVRWREDEVTAFMGTATGPLQSGMLRALTRAAGMGWSDDLRLITGSELSSASEGGRLGRRNIDLAIARWEEGRWTPLAAIEAKFTAQVNGTWKCKNPVHAGRYTNQLICYPMGCGHAALRHDQERPDISPPFIWLWDREETSLLDVPMGLTAADEQKYPQAWSDAWELQEEYRRIWKVATWTELRRSVVEALEEFEPRIVDAVLRALTPQSMPRGWRLAA